MGFSYVVRTNPTTKTIDPSLLPAYLTQDAIRELASSAGISNVVLNAGQTAPPGTPVGTIFFVRNA